MKDSRLYLVHVRDCLTRIRDYTQGGKPAIARQCDRVEPRLE